MYILSSVFGVWFIKLVRQFFFLIDNVIFNFIPTVYNLLIDIARTSVLSQADITTISQRIYQLLAIFMIFKVIFSLIMYVVNPDDFSDKSKGVSKLGTNIVISLTLLVLTPYLFSYAYQIQTIILEDDSLGTLIFGKSDDDTIDYSVYTSAGDKIAFHSLAPFFTPNTAIDELTNCISLTDTDGKFNENCSGINLLDDDIYTGEEETIAGLAEAEDGSGNLKYSPNYDKEDVANYVTGMETNSIGLMFRQNMILARAKIGEEEEFIMEYKFIFSTAVGVAVVFLLLSFCMDVALRSVKLSFLQLVAPIPILSYIDPKSGKDGMFKKWYQMCFKTYASLFIRLLALYFGVFIIDKINRLSDVVNGSYQSNMFVKIFVIIGVLMFIKQLPKILEGLGIKLDGDGKFILNPIKKLREEAYGGKQIIGAGAAGLAGAAAMGTNALVAGQKIKNAKGFWGKVGAGALGIGSIAAGGVSAASKGLVGAAKGEKFGKNFTNSYSAAMTKRTNRADREELGINAFDVAKEKTLRAMHIANAAQTHESELKHLDEYIKAGSTAKSRAEGEVDKKLSTIKVDGTSLGARKQKVDVLKNMTLAQYRRSAPARSTATEDDFAQAIADADADFFKARKKAVGAYTEHADSLNGTFQSGGSSVDFTAAGFTNDTIVTTNVSKMERLNTEHSMGQTVDSNDIGGTVQRAENRQSEIRNSEDYSKAALIAQQAQKEKK